MSKELEAFYKVLERSEFAYIGHKDVDIVVKALTPPTADEVCKALSEYLEHTVITRKNKHGITFNYDGTKKQTIISKYYDLLNIRMLLPTHLITLIGRFYEGESK